MSAAIAPTPVVQTLDECVRMVTACDSFAELKDTLPTYAPKFYNRRDVTKAELAAQKRVVQSFNAWAEREGRAARAYISMAGGAR